MKKLIFVLLFSCAALFSFGQESSQSIPKRPYPKEKFQIGFSPGALTVNLVKLEARYQVGGRHHLGLAGGPLVGQINVNRVFEGQEMQDLRGSFLMLSHKFYMKRQSENRASFIEHGVFYQNSNVSYDGFTFVPFQEDGLTLYKPEMAELQYNTQRAGYDIVIGTEYWMDQFYLNFSIGFGYAFLIKNDSDELNDYFLTRFTNGPNYQGLRILPALKLGFML